MSQELSKTMTTLAQAAGSAHAAFLDSLTPEQAKKLAALLEAGGSLGADTQFGENGITSTLYLQAPDGQSHVLHQRVNPAAGQLTQH